MTDATDDLPPEVRETPIDARVVERAAEAVDVDVHTLVETLVVVDADLRGRHSEFETDYEYVTVDGRRAYLVDEDEVDRYLSDLALDVEDATLDAVARAHAEQARLLSDRAVENPQFDGVGVVVGINTAEQMS